MDSFAQQLQHEAEPGWPYVDFEGLRARLNGISHRSGGTADKAKRCGGDAEEAHDKVSFADVVMDEVKTVERFLWERYGECRDMLKRLQEEQSVLEGWIGSAFADIEQHLVSIQRRFTSLALEVAKLLQYVDLNVTAVRTLLQEYTLSTGYFLTGSGQGQALERLSDPFELSELVVAVQAGLEKNHVLKRALKRLTASKRRVGAPPETEETTERSSLLDRSPSENRPKSPDSPANQNINPECMSLTSFFSRQLLVSFKTHWMVAGGAELAAVRKSRLCERKSDQSSEGCDLDCSDEDRYSLALHVFTVITVTGLYSANVGALAPFNEYYSEVTGNSTATSAATFGIYFFTAWVSMYWILGAVPKDSPLVLVTVGVSAMLGANMLYSLAFSVGPDSIKFGSAAGPAEIESTNSDLMLFASFALLGLGGVATSVLPAITCAKPSLSRSKKLEHVGASMVLASSIGSCFGGSVMAIASSIQYGEHNSARIGETGLHFNMFTVPALIFSIVWLAVLAIFFVPWLLSCFSRKKSQNYVRNWVPALDRVLFPQTQSVLGLPLHMYNSWSRIVCIQALVSAANTLTSALLVFISNSVFFVTWPTLSTIQILLAIMPLPLMVLSNQLVNRVGIWFSVRIFLLLGAIVSCFLLPMRTMPSTYSTHMFIGLSLLLICTSFVTQFISMAQASIMLEEYPSSAPLKSFGTIGPMVAVQSSRFCGSLFAFVLLALALQRSPADPVDVLNVCYAFLAIAQTVVLGLVILSK
mmetsp:Transcript_22591/g.42281  ORF Transcript_22591/g.42281 Transcript_22591/m.42281 type:complete len:757 (+) Transcript_22591:77-2347(+)